MRCQARLAAILTLAVTIVPGAAYADTAGGTNGPIVYTAYGPGGTGPQIWALEPDGSDRHELLAGHAELNTDPVWSPDGLRVAFYRAHDLVVSRADGTEDRVLLSGVAGAHVTWSPDGTRVAYVLQDDFDQGGGLWVMNDDGTDAHEIYHAPSINEPAWSPRGDEIAFEADDPAKPGDNMVLFVVTVDGTDVRQVTTFDEHGPLSYVHLDIGPAWSPDGSRLAFSSQRDSPCPTLQCQTFDLYITSADGLGPVTRLPEPGGESSPTWSPDGSALGYTAAVGGGDGVAPETALEIRDLASGSVRRLSSSARYGASWSARPGSRPSADLAASLSADTASVLPGQPVTLTATVRNAGLAPAESAAVEIRAAPGSTLDAAVSPGCAPAAGGALRCSVGTLAPGVEASFAVHTTRRPRSGRGERTRHLGDLRSGHLEQPRCGGRGGLLRARQRRSGPAPWDQRPRHPLRSRW